MESIEVIMASDNTIDLGTVAKGALKTEGNLSLYGEFEGTIDSKGSIKIFRSGKFNGAMRAGKAEIEGSANGSIEADELVVLKESATLDIKIAAPRLIVEPGAALKGEFVITPNREERNRIVQDRNKRAVHPARPVQLNVRFPDAASVNVIGDFNQWQENQSIPLKKDSDGLWNVELSLQPGRYEYLFIVDGAKRTDPQNPNKTQNSYGGENSVLMV